MRKCLCGVSSSFPHRPGHGLLGSKQRAAHGALLCFAIGGGGAGGSNWALCPFPQPWVRQRAGVRSTRWSSRPGGSTQTCPAEPPAWASGTMTDQQQAAKSGGLQQRHSLLMISEMVPATSPWGHSFHPLLQCQSHSSMGLAANDLLSTMVQRSPAQEWTCRGWDTGPAVPSSPEEYTMQPRGTQGSDTPRPPCCLLLQPIGPLKAAGWTGSPQTPPSSCRHQYGCPSTLLSQHCAAGPPKAGESHPQGIPSPVPAPAPLPTVCVAVVACMEMAMSVA